MSKKDEQMLGLMIELTDHVLKLKDKCREQDAEIEQLKAELKAQKSKVDYLWSWQ